MAPERPAGEAFLMDSSADIRHRPVVLDTGELSPVIRQRGRTVRREFVITVIVMLGAGAIAAGSLSIMTAA